MISVLSFNISATARVCIIEVTSWRKIRSVVRVGATSSEFEPNILAARPVSGIDVLSTRSLFFDFDDFIPWNLYLFAKRHVKQIYGSHKSEHRFVHKCITFQTFRSTIPRLIMCAQAISLLLLKYIVFCMYIVFSIADDEQQEKEINGYNLSSWKQFNQKCALSEQHIFASDTHIKIRNILLRNFNENVTKTPRSIN